MTLNLTKANCLATINPALARQWHPTMNGELKPTDVTAGSNKKVSWLCDHGHDWVATVNNRSNGTGCPICAGKIVHKSNCLLNTNPELAREWHPTKNGNLEPTDVTAGSQKEVWWLCAHGHKWPAPICNRSQGRGCPYCAGKKVDKSNCLQTINPDLASEWHPTKNGNLKPTDVTPFSHKKAWWKCDHGHAWLTTIAHRSTGRACPICAGKKVDKSNCLQTINPDLASEWHPTKNGNLKPTDVTAGSNRTVWWKGCKKGHPDFKAVICDRSHGAGCPTCAGKIVDISTCLATKNPTLALEWHPTKNGELTPNDITPYSSKKVWWQCDHGHEFPSTVANRSNGNGCFECYSLDRGLTLSEFISLATLRHAGRYDYSKVDYLQEKIEIICRIHGSFIQRSKNHLIGQGCKKCYEEKLYYPSSLSPELQKRFDEIMGIARDSIQKISL